MITNRLRLLLAVGLLCLALGARLPAAAAPALQLTEFPTPTAGADGRIIYIVQEGDTLWRISAITGLSIDEIRLLNGMTGDEIIVPGQQILLGLGGPALAATEPAPGATPLPPANITPTATPGPGVGTLCVLLFDDANGDALRQETETAIPEGAVSLTNRSGSVSLTGTTIPSGAADSATFPDPICFEGIQEGDYNLTVAVPEGYNPTTSLNAAIKLQAGEEAYIDFGAQISTAAIEASPPPAEGGRSPLLGFIGLALIVGGLGLAIFAGRLGMRKPPLGLDTPDALVE